MTATLQILFLILMAVGCLIGGAVLAVKLARLHYERRAARFAEQAWQSLLDAADTSVDDEREGW